MNQSAMLCFEVGSPLAPGEPRSCQNLSLFLLSVVMGVIFLTHFWALMSKLDHCCPNSRKVL